MFATDWGMVVSYLFLVFSCFGHYFDEGPRVTNCEYTEDKYTQGEVTILYVIKKQFDGHSSLKLCSVHSFVHGNMKEMFHVIAGHFSLWNLIMFDSLSSPLLR